MVGLQIEDCFASRKEVTRVLEAMKSYDVAIEQALEYHLPMLIALEDIDAWERSMEVEADV